MFYFNEFFGYLSKAIKSSYKIPANSPAIKLLINIASLI